MTVYANGLEISAKKQGNKIIAAMPDTCMTPPENPATPPGVPVPYPAFGTDGDLKNGTSSVKIGGETVSQKNLSYYAKTTGTEAGCAAKKGVVTSTNTGKAYAAAWSNNVKAEGEPVARFSDRATVNHASPVPNDGNGILVGGAGDGEGGDYSCDDGADKIESLLCRNKHEHGGSGDHGYLMRLAEQICGKEGTDTDSFKKHQEQLEQSRKALLKEIKNFEDAGCNLDDYEFHKKRADKDRTDNIREAIDGIRSGNPALMPGAGRSGFLGRAHPTCQNLAADRTDRTLNAIRGITGF